MNLRLSESPDGLQAAATLRSSPSLPSQPSTSSTPPASALSGGLRAELHRYLRAHSGETLSRRRLCAEVWRMNYYRASRTVDQTISVLRKQLPPGERIVTVFRAGYRHEFQSART